MLWVSSWGFRDGGWVGLVALICFDLGGLFSGGLDVGAFSIGFSTSGLGCVNDVDR